MKEKKSTIRDVIFHDMDILVKSRLKNGNNISINDLIDISSYFAASLFRMQWKQMGKLDQNDVEIILGNIGDFCYYNFKEDFTQEDFNKILKISQLLLKKPTFDDDSNSFLKPIKKKSKN